MLTPEAQTKYGIQVEVHGSRSKFSIRLHDYRRLVAAYPDKMRAAHATGLSTNTLLKWARKFGIDWVHSRTPGDIREQRKQDIHELYTAQKELKKLRIALANITQLHTQKPRLITIHKPKKSNTEATTCVLLSDAHAEERVIPSTINWLNEYNPQICEDRFTKLSEGIVKLTTIERTGVTLDELVLFLLGDFINGYIHDEYKKTNTMSPVQAILFVQGLIISLIDYIKKYGGYKKITVRCRSGNHSRTTLKPEFGTAGTDTLEWLLYQELAEHYKNDSVVRFEIRDANIEYCTIYDKVIRYLHGSEVKFNGGVGGVEIPIYKAIAQWDKAQRADVTMLAHFHTAKQGENFVVNGSIIGYNLFAESCKFSFQSPRQQFCLIDSHHGLQSVRPIFC